MKKLIILIMQQQSPVDRVFYSYEFQNSANVIILVSLLFISIFYTMTDYNYKNKLNIIPPLLIILALFFRSKINVYFGSIGATSIFYAAVSAAYVKLLFLPKEKEKKNMNQSLKKP